MSSPVLLNERQAKTVDVSPAPSFFSDLIRVVFAKKPEQSGLTVLLTAPERGCGVSFAASCIVAELASTGARVLLADAQTLASLRDAKLACNACERLGPGRVFVLGHQQIARDEAEHDLASPLAVLEALKREFTYIVLDAPSLAVSNLAFLLATSVEGVILVAKAGRTEVSAVSSSHNRLIALGAHVFGSVYNAR